MEDAGDFELSEPKPAGDCPVIEVCGSVTSTKVYRM